MRSIYKDEVWCFVNSFLWGFASGLGGRHKRLLAFDAISKKAYSSENYKVVDRNFIPEYDFILIKARKQTLNINLYVCQYFRFDS